MIKTIEISFDEAGLDRLDDVRKRHGINSNVELLRQALQLYERYLEETEKGSEMLFKTKDGALYKVRVDV